MSVKSQNLFVMFKWSLFLGVVGLLAWRMITLGLSEYYDRQNDSNANALNWYAYHPKALFTQARRIAAINPIEAERVLVEAAVENPADGQIYADLVHLWAERDQTKEAMALALHASRLGPMRAAVQWEVAAFWLRLGHLDQAITHWSSVLTLRSRLHKQLDPILLNLLEDPDTRSAFTPLLKKPPVWWPRFFRYVAANAKYADTVGILYNGRSHNGGKPDANERRYYTARLQKEGQWNQAYFVWLNSLGSKQLAVLGNLYNGDFELPLQNEDFGWRMANARGVTVKIGPVIGSKGDKALSVSFSGRRIYFNHLYQYLLLRPGDYQLRGRIRLDNLLSAQGVQWTLRCKSSERKLLGTSERFRATEPWRLFNASFTVPEQGCLAQEVRLELVARFAKERETRGTVWFDAMSIKRLQKEPS